MEGREGRDDVRQGKRTSKYGREIRWKEMNTRRGVRKSGKWLKRGISKQADE